MSLEIAAKQFEEIAAHLEAAYPEEGAGFLLGVDEASRQVRKIFPLPNHREDEARRNRYLISAQDMLRAEKEAEKTGLAIVGVFHSHPDHPSRPSQFDLDWALPWFSYLITSVQAGKAAGSQTWRLQDDRSGFIEEPLQIVEKGI